MTRPKLTEMSQLHHRSIRLLIAAWLEFAPEGGDWSSPGDDPLVKQVSAARRGSGPVSAFSERTFYYALSEIRSRGWTYEDYEGRERLYRAAVLWPRAVECEGIPGRTQADVEYADAIRAGQLLDLIETIEDVSLSSPRGRAELRDVWERSGRPGRARFRALIEELRDRGIIDIGGRLGLVPPAARAFAVPRAQRSRQLGILAVPRGDEKATKALRDLAETATAVSRSD